MGEEVNSKVVLMLALLVVLVVTISTWLLLNKLNTMEMSAQDTQAAVVYDAEALQGSSQAGKVALEILPPGGGT
ncbi:MAG: hypothetical protein KKB39_02095 [Nanoarchaeota archaeon]|nr:hypothetical protein [Nanoarchaeota archaeon]